MKQDRLNPVRAGQGRAALRRSDSRASRIRQAAAPFLRFVGNRPGLALGMMALIGTTGAVGWNALHQANRHPAPLFRPKAIVQLEAPKREHAAAPVPAPIPVPRPDPTTVGSVVTTPPPAPAPVMRASAPGGDAIGNLIRGGEPAARPAELRPAELRPAELRPDGRVIAVQKALTKLGYGPLKADGFLGTTTRQALERFERDKKLPVTGGLGTRTTRHLASASGTQIE